MSAPAAKLIAVCGATGKQGGGVVAALQRAGGFRIRGLTRDPDSASSRKLASTGVEVAKADFEDPASLDAAFKGCDAVFAVTDAFAGCGGEAAREVKQGQNLVDAAKRAGVKHFLWSTLEDTRPALAGIRPALQGDYTVPHFDAKAEIEQYARRELGAAATALLTSCFFDNLLPGGPMEPSKQADGSYALFVPVRTGVLAWCATPDIGNVAAEVIKEGPAKWGGKTVPVVGEHATLPQVADALSRQFGKQVAAVAPPPDDWAQAVQGFGVPDWVAKDMANMWSFYDREPMPATRPLEQTKAVYPDVQGLDAFLEAHKEALARHFV